MKKLHDEDEEFAALRARDDIHEVRAAWLIAFNGMLLEGLEVWLIVVVLGVQTNRMLEAAGAALAALAVVAVAGTCCGCACACAGKYHQIYRGCGDVELWQLLGAGGAWL